MTNGVTSDWQPMLLSRIEPGRKSREKMNLLISSNSTFSKKLRLRFIIYSENRNT